MIKKLLFTILTCLCTIGCTQTKKHKDYFQNGKISSEGQYTATNQQVGEWKYYHANGQLRQIVNFNDNGKFDGEYKTYRDNGNLKEINKYKNGKKVGEWYHYHDNKQLFVKRKYSSEGYRIGKWIYYYENGNTQYIESFLNGKKDGEWKRFYKNNALKSIQFYKNGKSNGNYTEYYDNSKLKVIKTFVNNKPTGNWKYYHKNGTLNYIAKHLNGKKYGDWVYFNDTGKVFKVEEHYDIDENTWNISDFKSVNPFELNDYILNDSSKFYDLERISRHIYSQNKTPILYYAANWCAPCLNIKNIMKKNPEIKDKLSQKFAFIKILQTDYERENIKLFSTKLSLTRDIGSIPTYTKLNKQGKTYNVISGSNWITEKPINLKDFEEKLKTNKIRYHFK